MILTEVRFMFKRLIPFLFRSLRHSNDSNVEPMAIFRFPLGRLLALASCAAGRHLGTHFCLRREFLEEVFWMHSNRGLPLWVPFAWDVRRLNEGRYPCALCYIVGTDRQQVPVQRLEMTRFVHKDFGTWEGPLFMEEWKAQQLVTTNCNVGKTMP